MYPHLKLKETTSQIKRLTYLSIQPIVVGDDLSRVAKIVVKMPYHNFEKLTAQFQEKNIKILSVIINIVIIKVYAKS